MRGAKNGVLVCKTKQYIGISSVVGGHGLYFFTRARGCYVGGVYFGDRFREYLQHRGVPCLEAGEGAPDRRNMFLMVVAYCRALL